MNHFVRLSVLAVIFASCQNSGNRKMTDPVPTTPTTFSTSPLPATDSTKMVPAVSPAATPVTTTPTNNSSNATAKLNPAHGAPGHNCDLPVGAPLNGPVNGAPAPATQTSSQPVIMNTTPPPPPAPANKNVRLNPAHGAPGHDCAVPVGQPLKS